MFYQYLLDDDEEVRTNACFGIGVLCVAANQQLIGQYEAILSRLSQVLSKETNLRMIDNICSCLCRMIVISPTHVPLGQVCYNQEKKILSFFSFCLRLYQLFFNIYHYEKILQKLNQYLLH